MLEIRDLTVNRGKKRIWNSVSLQLEPGTMTALIGRNGCGKSTLLSCINQQLSYQGDIFLTGQDLHRMKSKERARQISLLPQVLATPHISVEELVQMGRNPYHELGERLRADDRKAIDRAIETVGIGPLLDHYVDEISGGERQKVYLAMALAQDTPLMILDEPTTYMDMAYGTEFLEQLKLLQLQDHKTLLVVMHDLSQALYYADHILVMQDGKLVFDGSREECLASGVVEEVFGVKRYEAEGRVFFV